MNKQAGPILIIAAVIILIVIGFFYWKHLNPPIDYGSAQPAGSSGGGLGMPTPITGPPPGATPPSNGPGSQEPKGMTPKSFPPAGG